MGRLKDAERREVMRTGKEILGKGRKSGSADNDKNARDWELAPQSREKVYPLRLGERVTRDLSFVFQRDWA